MKRKLFSVFVLLIFFFSCKMQNVQSVASSNDKVIEPEVVLPQLSEGERRDVYLRSLMDMQNYSIEATKVEDDLLGVLQSIKEKEGNVSTSPIIRKVDTDIFNFCGPTLFSIDGKTVEENIELSLYRLQNGDKKGFAITSNDLRLGEIIAIVEDGEFDVNNDPFMQLVLSNLKGYVHSTLTEWQALLNKKSEFEYTQKSVWKDIVESGKYEYLNWKFNNGNLHCLLSTGWHQYAPFNNVIKKLKHPKAPAGCVSVAIAQIMTYHGFPKHYYGTKDENFEAFKRKITPYFPVAEKWDGKYRWGKMGKYDSEPEDSEMTELQLASLMYEIAESSYATYTESGTGMYTEDYARSLLFHDYLTGVCTHNSIFDEMPPFLESEYSKRPIRVYGWNVSDITRKFYKPDNSGHKIRYENYSFDAIKSSIDALAPVLIRGYGIDPKPTTPSALSNNSEGIKFGHAWVIDGYCNLSCIARHTETRERKLITADYVHCNLGWGEKRNGYFISNLFTFGFDKPTASDGEIIRPKSKADGHVKYDIVIFPNLIPKSYLSEEGFVHNLTRYRWRPL